MAMEFSSSFIPQANEDFYRENAQAWIDGFFDDSTLVRTIKEEVYPFNKVYEEYTVHVDTISEYTTNTTKVEGDYLSLIYKDCSHQTYRGQKIIYEDRPYLIYQKTEPLSKISKTKMIKCNNKISFVDKTNGTIITEPIFIGFELSSTNNNVTKDATVENRRLICLVQGNEHTSKFVEGQRFLLTKSKAFKVTQIYDINKDDIDEEYPSMITLYIEWTTSGLPSDNLSLLVADYYPYVLSINSTNLSITPSATGQLSATVKLNDVIQSGINLKWSTSDSNVVTINSLGSYQVVGSDGSTAVITCSIDGNETIFDTVNVNVVATPIVDKQIIINPTTIDGRLLQGKFVDIHYGVYNGNVLTSDIVTVTPSGANSANYTLSYTSGKVTVTNLLKSTTPLVLTFTSGSLTSKTISIPLGGIM